MRQVHQSAIEMQRYQDIPFEKIVSELDDKTFQDIYLPSSVWCAVFRCQQSVSCTFIWSAEKESHYSSAKFDLSCFINDGQSQLAGSMAFATALFNKETIEQMSRHYVNILEQLAFESEKVIADYKVLSSEEQQQILLGWNQTDEDYPKDKTIVQLFEEQVIANPNNTAVVFEESSLTYAELNAKANQLARYLHSQGDIKPDTLIGICVDRSLDMMVGILGIMKAGAAYVPISPEYPDERIAYILEDTNTQFVLTQSRLTVQLDNAVRSKYLHARWRAKR